jgi:hypothetical protein
LVERVEGVEGVEETFPSPSLEEEGEVASKFTSLGFKTQASDKYIKKSSLYLVGYGEDNKFI